MSTSVVPLPLSSFIGRERELLEIHALFVTTRLVTLAGVGGVGKTRLAQEFVRRAISNGQAVAFVELAPVADRGLVLSSIAAEVGVREQSRQPLVETLAGELRSRPLLLVLDNCEHLVQACAELADHLVRVCPELKIMTTSREPLRVEGEVVRRVPPLSVPSPAREGRTTATDVASSEAGQLFIQRARATGAPFGIDERNALAVAEICRRLDGIPLALELAASRVGVLSVDQIRQRLDDRFRLLTSAGRTTTRRHQTLRATVEWSYALLEAPERLVFERLSTFVGGADLAAAEDVCSGEGIEPSQVLDVLGQLVAKSLVVAEIGSDGLYRYSLLETLRHFADERLRARAEWDSQHLHHAAWFLNLAESAAPHTFDADPALIRLERDHDNLRAALRYLIDQQNVDQAQRLGAALGRLWFYRGHATEGRRWLAELLALPQGATATETRAELYYRAGMLAWVQGDAVAGQAPLEAGLQLAQQLESAVLQSQMLFALGHTARARGAHLEAQQRYEAAVGAARSAALRRQEAIALQGLAGVAYDQGDYGAARRHLEEVVRIASELGAKSIVVQSLSILGDVCRQQRDYAAGHALAKQALEEARALGARWWIASSAVILAQITLEQEQYELTASLAQESLTLARELGDQTGLARALEVIAQLAMTMGQAETGVLLGVAAAGLRAALGVPLAKADRKRLETRLADARRRLIGPEAERAANDGKSPSLQQAIAAAMQTVAKTRPDDSAARAAPARPAVDVLTRRERDIVKHVARGLTNRQISELLVISIGTVERHVSNVLSKLDLATRSQIAVWAVQQQLQTDPVEPIAPSGRA